MNERKIDDTRTWRVGDELRVEVRATVTQVFGGGMQVNLDYTNFSALFANTDGRWVTEGVRVRDIVPAPIEDGIYVLEPEDDTLQNTVAYIRNSRVYETFRDAESCSGSVPGGPYTLGRLIEALDFRREVK